MGLNQVGDHVGRYKVVEEIGRGAMGAVYRAFDETLRRHVALKILLTPSHLDSRASSRLLHEARMASRLSHPNICTVYETGEDDGRAYVAMEHVDGHTLRAALADGPLPLEAVARYASQIADALFHAHRRGVLHRDLKSANVMVDKDDRVKVLDFGLAQALQSESGSSESPTWTLTEIGGVAGTPAYVSPEVLRGERATARSDIWALGVLMYELATGHLPFAGRTVAEVFSGVLQREPNPLPDTLPDVFRGIVRRCLSKDPTGRYGDAGAVAQALGQLVPAAQFPPPARKAWPLAPVIAATALIAVVFAMWKLHLPFGAETALREGALTAFPAGAGVRAAAISPDGRHVAYGDTSGFFLLSLDDGEKSRIPGSESIPVGSCSLRWFPDGQSILVNVYRGDGRADAWAISFLRGSARRVLDDAHDPAISPDGSTIAFERNSHLWLSDIEGRNAREVATTRGGFSFLAWSPSGHRLAYVKGTSFFADSSRWGSHFIQTCDVHGGNPTDVYAHSWLAAGLLSQNGLCWLPDGRLLFCLPDSLQHQDHVDLWSIDVDPTVGKARSKPQRLTRWAGFYASDLSVSADGRRLCVVKSRIWTDLFVAEFGEGYSRLGPVHRLTLDQYREVPVGWTPDSRSVYFLYVREGGPRLFRQAIGQQLPEQLPQLPGMCWWALPLPDGTGFLCQVEGDSLLTRVSLDGRSKPLAVAFRDPDDEVLCAKRPGSRCVLSEQQDDERVFYEVDPDRGRGAELARTHWPREAAVYYPSSLSPDGKRVALPLSGGARVIDLDTGRSTVVLVDPHARFAYDWASESLLLFSLSVGPPHEGPPHDELLLVDLSGRVRMKAMLKWDQVLVSSPDGRSVAFDRSLDEANAWLLEGFQRPGPRWPSFAATPSR